MRYRPFHRGLVFLAGLMLCLHSIFPHVHAPHGDDGAVVVFAEHSGARPSFFEVLVDLVTADLGEEHLEHLAATDVDLDLSPLLPASTMLWPAGFPFGDASQPGPQNVIQEILAYHPLLPEDEVFARQRPLRGPPSVG